MIVIEKLKFQLFRLVRMGWFVIRYSLYKWKKIDGISIPVKLNYGHSVLRFIDNGEYEQGEITIIKKTLEKNDVVLELGTGMGFVSAYCAGKIGDEKVFTFEANPLLENTIDVLYKKNSVQPNLTFALLGEKAGTQNFYRHTKSFLASSAQRNDEGNQVATAIPVLALNEKIQQISPTYLMMDIEGGEYEVFSIIDFQSIKKIQFELHPAVISEDKIQEIFDKLKAHNFVEDTTFKLGNNYYFQRQ